MQDTGVLLNVLFLWIVNFSENPVYFLPRLILWKTIVDLLLTFSERVYCTFREFCIRPCVPRPQRGQKSGFGTYLSLWPYWLMIMWTCEWQAIATWGPWKHEAKVRSQLFEVNKNITLCYSRVLATESRINIRGPFLSFWINPWPFCFGRHIGTSFTSFTSFVRFLFLYYILCFFYLSILKRREEKSFQVNNIRKEIQKWSVYVWTK